MLDFTKRTAVISEDGSSTFHIDGSEEHFHSVHGAYNESMHIFIHAGLNTLANRQKINILEVGFGTGLNALLTLIHQTKREIHYDGIEAYPLNEDEVKVLNYSKQVGNQWEDSLLKIHDLPPDEETEISQGFFLKKRIGKIENLFLPENHYDLVYYDAFSPIIQPELWDEEIFKKLFVAMKKHAILTTYCAKGSVKRAMKSAGFQLEGLPGPIGKREMTRARK